MFTLDAEEIFSRAISKREREGGEVIGDSVGTFETVGANDIALYVGQCVGGEEGPITPNTSISKIEYPYGIVLSKACILRKRPLAPFSILITDPMFA